MKYFYIVLLVIIIFKSVSFASEKDLINLAEIHNKNGEYYNAITEIMRYQYLYPQGYLYPRSLLVLSEAYYYGGNYEKTIKTLTECHGRFKDTTEGEKAFYSLGFVRLVSGSPYFAFRSYREYQYIYKDGAYKEDTARDMCYTLALLKDLKGAARAAGDYQVNYPEGKYLNEIKNLQVMIDNEINRPEKSLLVSVIGSIAVPGFGHFYTGNYAAGFFSLVSNAVLIYLFYNGYKAEDKTQMLVFGFAEFTFYQYSLYSSIRNVYEYNSNDKFYKTIRVGASKEF